MIPVLLSRVKTADGITLEGVIVPPRKNRGIALLWIHGLKSRFSSGQTLIRELSARTRAAGYAYFKFNTRGHDIVAQGPDKKLLGAAFEKFEDSPKDIDAVIRLAKRLGYTKIVLAGHSTGANKALYYMYAKRPRAVRALILAGAISDIIEWKRRGLRAMKRGISTAKKISRRNPNAFMPGAYGIITAGRFLSLYDPGRAENVFPYVNPGRPWRALRSVQVPIAAIFGSRDEYLDRSAKDLIALFQQNAIRAPLFFGAVIKGANHGFRTKELDLAKTIIHFIKRAVV